MILLRVFIFNAEEEVRNLRRGSVETFYTVDTLFKSYR